MSITSINIDYDLMMSDTNAMRESFRQILELNTQRNNDCLFDYEVFSDNSYRIFVKPLDDKNVFIPHHQLLPMIPNKIISKTPNHVLLVHQTPAYLHYFPNILDYFKEKSMDIYKYLDKIKFITKLKWKLILQNNTDIDIVVEKYQKHNKTMQDHLSYLWTNCKDSLETLLFMSALQEYYMGHRNNGLWVDHDLVTIFIKLNDERLTFKDIAYQDDKLLFPTRSTFRINTKHQNTSDKTMGRGRRLRFYHNNIAILPSLQPYRNSHPLRVASTISRWVENCTQ